MKTTNFESRWYALYTRVRWGKKVSEILTHKGVENYCPLNKTVRQGIDGKKLVPEPYFSSYVFVKTTEDLIAEILKINGTINFVYWLDKPVVISNEEIDCIKEFLKDHNNVKLEKTPVGINDVIGTMQGPLMEYEGNIITVKSKTVKLVLPSLGYTMIAEVEKANVEIIIKKSFTNVVSAFFSGMSPFETLRTIM